MGRQLFDQREYVNPNSNTYDEGLKRVLERRSAALPPCRQVSRKLHQGKKILRELRLHLACDQTPSAK